MKSHVFGNECGEEGRSFETTRCMPGGAPQQSRIFKSPFLLLVLLLLLLLLHHPLLERLLPLPRVLLVDLFIATSLGTSTPTIAWTQLPSCARRS